MASGALRAAQNEPSPLLVPKMKIEASGSRTSGSISSTTIPRLNGRTTSNPRTCRIAEIAALIGSLVIRDER
jgi:hypothetical protein